MPRPLLGMTLLVVAALLVACARGDEGLGERADASLDEEEDTAISVIWDSVESPLDVQQLRSIMTDELNASVTDMQITQSVICFPPELTAHLEHQELVEDERQARIITTHLVTDPAEGGDDPEVEEVVRTWEFTRVGEEWRLSALPACPYEPGLN